MRWPYQLRLRLFSLFRRQVADSDLSEELQFHLQQQIDDYVAAGMDPQEARRAALRSLGPVEPLKEECREMRNVSFIENTLQDVRFGFRVLRRSPGFSILAILCLTLGIGANAAVFSWIEGTLLNPYPAVANPDRLLVLAGTARGLPRYDSMSSPDLADFRRDCRLIDSFVSEKIVGGMLGTGERAETATGSLVSANYFDALGVRPLLGRGFEPGEDTGRNAHPVVVISYQLWNSRFHGDRDIIGKTQLLNGVQHTIVGVTPEGFHGTFVGYAFQFWVPASMQELFDPGGYKLEDRGARWVEGFARLKPGVSESQAQQEISAVAQRLEKDYPETNRGRGVRLLPLWESPFNGASRMRPTLSATLAVVLLVLLIACANVANLMLVRSLGRRHEMTVRLAVGARRGRLVKQLLTEGLILSAFAAAGGLIVARWCRSALVLFMPPSSVPIYLPGRVDWRVLTFTAAVCVISTLLFALVPAFQTSNIDLSGALKSEARGVVGAHHRAWLRSGLILVQVSLSFILLVGAGLLMRSLQTIRNASPGFVTRDLMISLVDLLAAGYDGPRAQDVETQLIERVQALPGVESAAYGRVSPFTYREYSSAPIAVDGYEPARDELPTVWYNEVGPGYLATLGIPLVSGREFTRADDETSAPVAIVNQTMVSQYWRGKDPVGQRLQVKGKWMQVVGVAKDAKYRSFTEAAAPFFYVPLRQNPAREVMLNIRTHQDAGAMKTMLARETHALDPDLPVRSVIPMPAQIERMTFAQRIAGTLLGTFGGLALLLAAVGLYGVMSYAVSQSRRDLGLRMALGATASDVLRLVLSNGLALTAGGIVVGAVVALGTSRLLGYLLYKVSPRDPFAFGLAFIVMVVASLAACFIPAWRAARIDPVRALRE